MTSLVISSLGLAQLLRLKKVFSEVLRCQKPKLFPLDILKPKLYQYPESKLLNIEGCSQEQNFAKKNSGESTRDTKPSMSWP